jgi:hypothetical protein
LCIHDDVRRNDDCTYVDCLQWVHEWTWVRAGRDPE